MRFVYLDPGLHNDLGHHANSCRMIRRELGRREIPVMVLALLAIRPELAAELAATPFFRHFTYGQTDGDPICGWLNAFTRSARETTEDLARLRGLRPDDIVYLNSAQPAQLLAMVDWQRSLPIGERPHVVLEFGSEPGVDVAGEPGHFRISLRDYRADPRAMFYRHAARQLDDADLARFHMVTFDPAASEVYSAVINRPVGVLPLPQFAGAVVTSRVGRRPLTVAVLGHQRWDKGFHLMPEVARRLLAEETGIRLLVHNGAPQEMAQVQAELRAVAAAEPRLILDERMAGPALWAALLDRSDLIICPYDPKRFVAAYSAVATEAVAHGIPVVVPAGTSLSRLLDAFGGPGTSFDGQLPAAIVAATRQAIADFDRLAARAAAAAAQWDATMGVSHMVSALLARCGG